MHSSVSISDNLHRTVLLIACMILSMTLHAEDKEGERHHPLVPSLAIVQYAGNIGEISLGIGWEHGHEKQWATHVLLGYLPKEVMFDDYFCMTVREQFQPWTVNFREQYSLEPLVFNVSANTLFSGSFWYQEPVTGYYKFSSKLRFHLGVGSRIDLHLPDYRAERGASKRERRLSLYYEFSTYDLALISYFSNKAIHLPDIFCLGIGFQYKLF